MSTKEKQVNILAQCETPSLIPVVCIKFLGLLVGGSGENSHRMSRVQMFSSEEVNVVGVNIR
jgi:hypothetical protein